MSSMLSCLSRVLSKQCYQYPRVIQAPYIVNNLKVQHQHRFISVTPELRETFVIQDEEDFNKKVLKSSKPVVVQFHATWCGPCKQLSPRMEKSVAAFKDNMDLAQVDIDNNPDIAMSYSVGAVPAVLGIKDGKVVDKFIGLKDDDQIEKFVKNLAKM